MLLPEEAKDANASLRRADPIPRSGGMASCWAQVEPNVAEVWVREIALSLRLYAVRTLSTLIKTHRIL